MTVYKQEGRPYHTHSGWPAAPAPAPELGREFLPQPELAKSSSVRKLREQVRGKCLIPSVLKSRVSFAPIVCPTQRKRPMTLKESDQQVWIFSSFDYNTHLNKHHKKKKKTTYCKD